MPNLRQPIQMQHKGTPLPRWSRGLQSHACKRAYVRLQNIAHKRTGNRAVRHFHRTDRKPVFQPQTVRWYIPVVAKSPYLIYVFLFGDFDYLVQHSWCDALTAQVCVYDFNYIYKDFALLDRRRDFALESPEKTDNGIFNYGDNKIPAVPNDIFDFRIFG